MGLLLLLLAFVLTTTSAYILYRCFDYVPFTHRKRFVFHSISFETRKGHLSFQEVLKEEFHLEIDKYCRGSIKLNQIFNQLLYVGLIALIEEEGRVFGRGQENWLRLLVSSIRWRLVIINLMDFRTASTPGGGVVTYTAYANLVEWESERLAFTFAHEIAHVICRHNFIRLICRRAFWAFFVVEALVIARWNFYFLILLGLLYYPHKYAWKYLVLLPQSRRDEYEADIVGYRIYCLAGYDPYKGIDVYLKVLEVFPQRARMTWIDELCDTHPLDKKRTRNLINIARRLPSDSKIRQVPRQSLSMIYTHQLIKRYGEEHEHLIILSPESQLSDKEFTKEFGMTKKQFKKQKDWKKKKLMTSLYWY